ncbi:MAG: PIG-L family deacetylase [Psychroflexus maritimus]
MKYIYIAISYLFCFQFLFAQTNNTSSSELFESFKQLKNPHRMLYVAAHPDDENTHLISYFSNHLSAETAYISLTRGDGGQNLIGTELKDQLGVIRTHELLEARNLDGATQFFSRAKDYGFSKNPEETFTQWNKEKVLYDLIFAIRKFQPDVIINRFAHNTPGSTHGHHTASAILSYEAFEKAADPNVFPEQISEYGLSTWQAKKLFFNDSWFFYESTAAFEEANRNDFLSIDIGEYYPLKGISNGELASLSRSQHKSQGFGSLLNRGTKMEYLKQLKGIKTENNEVFSNLPQNWKEITGSKKIDKQFNQLLSNFNFEKPHHSIQDLIELKKLMEKTSNGKHQDLIERKIERIQKLLIQCTGIHVEALVAQPHHSPGEEINFQLNTTLPHTLNMELTSLETPFSAEKFDLKHKLQINEVEKFDFTVEIPANHPYSTPFWLEESTENLFFKVNEEAQLMKAIDLKNTSVNVLFSIEGEVVKINIPIEFKYNDPVMGEQKDLFFVTPKASLKNDKSVYVFTNDEWREVEIELKSFANQLSGKLQLEIDGWEIKPSFYEIERLQKNEQLNYTFMIRPTSASTSTQMQAKFITPEGEIFNQEVSYLEYSHFPKRQLINENTSSLLKIEAKTKGEKVAYLAGAGDEIMEAINELGYEVDELMLKDLGKKNLHNYQAVVLGIRAFNVHEELAYKNKYLFEYVENGGNLIVFYNTSRGLKTEEIAPKKLILNRGRVTNKKAEVQFLNRKHPLFNSPNLITEEDFEDWVQERGLYFASSWHSDFIPLLEMQDPGEKTQKGSLLHLPYGKGNYMYTGLSFFRQLPAGVEGAYRILANLISLENEIE